MADQSGPDTVRRLSTLEGLVEAGIVESIDFNPFTGLAGVYYTPNWIQILRSGDVLLVDPFFGAAFLADDPVALRMFVEREGARLRDEVSSTERSKPARRGRKSGR